MGKEERGAAAVDGEEGGGSLPVPRRRSVPSAVLAALPCALDSVGESGQQMGKERVHRQWVYCHGEGSFFELT
jgi:hypothetical protein